MAEEDIPLAKKADTTSLASRTTILEGDVLALEGTVDSLGLDLGLVEGRTTVLEGRATNLETTTGTLTTNLGLVEGRTTVLEADTETLKDRVDSIVAAVPVFDESKGYYTNDSIATYLSTKRDGKVYGVDIPKSIVTDCTKTGANAGVPNPVPGTNAVPAVDPYTAINPFFVWEVNGYIETDGTPRVTAFKGDANFSRTPAAGRDVWMLAPTLYWRMADNHESTAVNISVCDAPLEGFTLQPKAKLPSGVKRPYMLYAKYPLSEGARSISGVAPLVRTVSHNTLITLCKNSTTGYSGKSFADDWYHKVIFLLKYANKHSQSVFGGTTSYSLQYRPAVSETGVQRVILTTAQANNFLVGSSVLIGTGSNMGTSASYNVADTTVLSVDDIGGGQSALNLDLSEDIDTTTDLYVSSWHWKTGTCDLVQGLDGAPYTPTATNQPFTLQGIELSHGFYEVLGDVILANTGDGWRPRLVQDSKLADTSVTANYVDTGVQVETTDNAWKYPIYPANAGGLLFGAGGYTGSATTGMADGTYINPDATTGTREWMGLGLLSLGTSAGLWFVLGNNALSTAYWYLGGRLSGVGRAG